ncbi:GNAT family N-acetyltransferase [Catenulispora yoronensis]|uniref:GNAT family N-acetyltransferase n=1 Tax=Catenulispora yoronensis TaxID=450799 RepID=A0ABP5F7W3_9ACTN
MITSDIVVGEVPWDDPEAAALRAAQRAEIDGMYGQGSEPGVAPSASDIAFFLVARAEGRAVGCGGLRPLEPGAAELKRMYVVPDWRGRGVSGAVLAALEAAAVARGWRTLRLETGPKQAAAIRFYERSGYTGIPCFGAYAEDPTSFCYQREL